jgi:hypothetical protein
MIHPAKKEIYHGLGGHNSIQTDQSLIIQSRLKHSQLRISQISVHFFLFLNDYSRDTVAMNINM